MRQLLRRSTEDTSAHLRVRYWRDVIHESVVEMDLVPSTMDDFQSHIELCPLTNIVPHSAQGSSQKITRDRHAISRGDKHVYYLISQSRHRWRCMHAGQDHVIGEGESVLVDSHIPYTFMLDGFDALSVELPIDWVRRWIPDTGDIIGRPLQASDGWGLALRGVKEALSPRALAACTFPDALIEDQLGALLALAAGADTPSTEEKDETFIHCASLIRARLSTPGLVASDVALACSVSLRTLHRSFAAQGKTFAGFLMQARVDEAARLLADRRFRHLTIAEIGRRCGFLDHSHFARQFYRLRQVSPSCFRSRAS